MTRIILAAALALSLAGCGLTPDEKAAVRDSLAEVAVDLIAEAKADGFSPVELSESKLRIVGYACKAAETFAPALEAYIIARKDDPEFEALDLRGYAAAVCAVALAVLTPAAPDESPIPTPNPAV